MIEGLYLVHQLLKSPAKLPTIASGYLLLDISSLFPYYRDALLGWFYFSYRHTSWFEGQHYSLTVAPHLELLPGSKVGDVCL